MGLLDYKFQTWYKGLTTAQRRRICYRAWCRQFNRVEARNLDLARDKMRLAIKNSFAVKQNAKITKSINKELFTKQITKALCNVPNGIYNTNQIAKLFNCSIRTISRRLRDDYGNIHTTGFVGRTTSYKVENGGLVKW